MTSFQSIDGHLLYIIHWQIDVFPVVSVIRVAVILHFVGLVVLTTRVIHYHDKSTVERFAYHLFIKRLWGIFFRLAYSLSFVILKSIGKLLWRYADGILKHVIDLAEHTCLSLLNGRSLLVFLYHIAQLQTILT